MAKKKPADTKVSPETLDNKLAPETDKQLTPEGFDPESAEAKELAMQRRFLNEVAKPAFQHAKDARRKYDQEWISRNLFWRGYQFSRYLPQSQTVVLSGRQSARVPINLVAAYMRAIRNQVTSFRPKIEIMPTNPSDEGSKTQARYEQRLADYLWDHLKLKKMVKETITQGLLYSIGGPWEIVYDENKKEVKIWLIDPFDFFIDPLAEEWSDESPQYCIKAVRQAMSDVTHDPQFNLFARKEIAAGDANLAASEYKQFLIQSLRQVSPRISQDSPTLILKQGHFKRRRDDGTPYMVKLVWTDQNFTPLLYEEIDTDEYDYAVYKADLNPKEIYGESWIKHVMAINRVINSLESSAFEYNYHVAKGRIVIDKDAGVNHISNVHGEIISANKGARVESLDMAPLPVAVPQQIERMWHYMEDVSGIHEASLGRIPTGVKTGVGIAELKQADATSQDDLVDNLEDFLEEVFRKVFKNIAKNYDSHQVIKALGVRAGQEKYFAVIGSQFAKKKQNPIPGHENQVKIGPDWFDIAQIKEDNQIRIQVGSWLGYTKEAMQQKVLQYYQLQLIDQATALRELEFGDYDTIVQQSRIEALLKRPPQPGPDGQPGVDQYSLALTENDMMTLEGKSVPVSENDDHIVHIAVHQEALGKGADEIVGLHIDKHQMYLGINKPIAGANGLDTRDSAAGGMNPNSSGPQIAPQQGQNPAQGAMAQATPVTNPVQPNVPIPPGTPPGQQLPQQNVQQAMTNTNAQVAGGAGGPGQ